VAKMHISIREHKWNNLYKSFHNGNEGN